MFLFLSQKTLDSPIKWQIGFQEPAVPAMEGIIFHTQVLIITFFIIIFVVWFLLKFISYFTTLVSKKKLLIFSTDKLDELKELKEQLLFQDEQLVARADDLKIGRYPVYIKRVCAVNFRDHLNRPSKVFYTKELVIEPKYLIPIYHQSSTKITGRLRDDVHHFILPKEMVFKRLDTYLHFEYKNKPIMFPLLDIKIPEANCQGLMHFEVEFQYYNCQSDEIWKSKKFEFLYNHF